MKARKATPLARIELLILDVDGVLTDGRLYFAARGESLKVFHVRDGHGIKLLMAAGLAVAVVSGRRSEAVAARVDGPGVVVGAGNIGAEAIRSSLPCDVVDQLLVPAEKVAQTDGAGGAIEMVSLIDFYCGKFAAFFT